MHGRLAQLEERHVYTVDVRGSSPLSPTSVGRLRARNAEVAQSVEHVTENHGVAGSIPALGTHRVPFYCTKHSLLGT